LRRKPFEDPSSQMAKLEQRLEEAQDNHDLASALPSGDGNPKKKPKP
jgi:hypothetical protein